MGCSAARQCFGDDDHTVLQVKHAVAAGVAPSPHAAPDELQARVAPGEEGHGAPAPGGVAAQHPGVGGRGG